MIIQIWHSRNSDFADEFYAPMKSAEFYSEHTFIFPHDGMNVDSRESLKWVDLFIAEVSQPATGLGIEIGFASMYGKRILCIYKKWTQPSNSLKQLTDAFLEYDNSLDLVQKISQFLKNKIYVGCALTHASQDFRDSISIFKEWLRVNYEVLDFTGVLDGWTILSTDIYTHDRHCVINSDLFIAECSYPSTGLGYEIATAIENNKKLLLIAHRDALVTRMILGIPEHKAKMVRYNNLDDIFPIVSQMFFHG